MFSSTPSIRLLGRFLAFLVLAVPALAQSVYSTPYSFTTLAGSSSVGSADGPGATARFYMPSGVAIDAAGNLYVADQGNRTIRKITPSGIVSTLAGAAGETGSADGTGSAARFNTPSGLAADTAGNIYVADTSNYTIRKVTPAGVVSTLAGTAGSAGAVDGTGSAARFSAPSGIAIDAAGNIYVADASNNTIRKITPAGAVTTLAGFSGQSDGVNGNGSAARFSFPQGVAVDGAGNVYVADTNNNAIRKITPDGTVTTFAGAFFFNGSVDAIGGAARFRSPVGVAIDPAGNLYVADAWNQTVRKITPAGAVTTLAGSPEVMGSVDGTSSAARFLLPQSVAVDPAGNVYVADSYNNTIRRISPAAVVTTWAGTADPSGSADGTGSAASFQTLGGAAVGPAGEVYVADTKNHTIRKITPTGVVTTFAGSAGLSGSADGTGSAARFSYPNDVAVDSSGSLVVADGANSTIRKITPSGVVTTLAGMAGQNGSADGSGSDARFNDPVGVALDAAGNVYVADYLNSTIRKITPAGVVTTLAGAAGQNGSADGTGSAARFLNPQGVAVDATGNVFVADTTNSTIRKITPTGVVSTLTGATFVIGTADGPGGSARFSGPRGITVDRTDSIFVADRFNSTIRRITSTGVVSTIAGLAKALGNDDGTGKAARFARPSGIAVDASGTLYVTSDTAVRKGQLAAAPVITTQPQNQSVTTGGSVQFSVAVTGVPAPTYQWLYNGNPFAGATGSTLSFASATTADAGDYTVVVTNALGTATSSRATLTVTAVTAPTPPPPSSGAGGGGGGGAIDLRFVLALFALAATRRLTAGRPA